MPATADPTADAPPEPTFSATDVPVFRVGTHNGYEYDADDLTAMAANFALCVAGDPPWYVPFVSLNHDDGLRFGRVTGARVKPADGEPTLFLDLAELPKSVRDWIKANRLEQPSIEHWEPGDFEMPDGLPNARPVLKCLTLLGNSPPGVRGLSRLSTARIFRHQRGPARKFWGVTGMDRQTIIAALQAAGMDVNTITDAVPDETLKAVLDTLQKAAVAPDPDPDAVAPVVPKPVAMSDSTPAAPAATGGSPAPASVTVKFHDRHGRERTGTLQQMADENNALLASVRHNAAAVDRDLGRRLEESKRGKVKAFRDEMCGGGGRPAAYMTPAQFDAQEPLLLALDDVTVRKFADGKTTGSALEEAFDRLRKAYTAPVRRFGDRIADPATGGPGGVRQDVIDRTLAGSPEGRAVLAARTQK